jgi:hypothetical protein
VFHDSSLYGKSWRYSVFRSASWRGGPGSKATVVASLSADNQSKGDVLTVGWQRRNVVARNACTIVSISPCFFLVRSMDYSQRYSLLDTER